MAKTNKAAKAAPVVKTTIKVTAKVAEAIEIIKEYQPHVKVAYFNEAGDYHFHKRAGFVAVPIGEADEDTDLEVDTDEDNEDETVDAGGKKLEF
jgi:hypothetical protein